MKTRSFNFIYYISLRSSFSTIKLIVQLNYPFNYAINLFAIDIYVYYYLCIRAFHTRPRSSRPLPAHSLRHFDFKIYIARVCNILLLPRWKDLLYPRCSTVGNNSFITSNNLSTRGENGFKDKTGM